MNSSEVTLMQVDHVTVTAWGMQYIPCDIEHTYSECNLRHKSGAELNITNFEIGCCLAHPGPLCSLALFFFLNSFYS